MKQKKQANNKGFSLVELIVVVLIMSIIAVSLAPQVMKWVDNAKIATDVSNYNSLVSNCQLAMTDYKAYSEMKVSNGYTVVISTSGTTITAKTGSDVNDIIAAMDAMDPAWKDVKVKANAGTNYVITISETGSIERTTPPSTAGTDLE